MKIESSSQDIYKFLGPPHIYRYRSENDYAFDELENGYLYFPHRQQLNDPFDCFPNLLKIPSSKTHLRKNLQIHLKKHLNKSRQEAREIARNSDLKEYHESLVDSYLKTLNSKGIGCFTIDPTNFMMWSHYANYHKGFCLGFDYSKDETYFRSLEAVKYVDKFETKEYLPNQFGELRHLFFTKSSVWKQEKEFRVLKSEFGKHDFSRESLNFIIFGLKCSKETIIKVLDVTEGKYPNVEYYIGSLPKNTFGIVLNKIQL